MNSKKTNAAVAYTGEDDFRYETVTIEPPRADEILVNIKGVGICHTDLSFKSGAIPYPFPAVFGHEGSGVVEAIGDAVTKVKTGDHVVITFRSCGACELCSVGDTAYCQNFWPLNIIGCREDGTSSLSNDVGSVASNFFGQSSFAAHTITYEHNIVKIDPNLPIELFGPLGCSVQTGAGAVMRSLRARKGSSILIAGGGSVGLSAVMGAAIQQCATIIVLEPFEGRRELAKELGATHCIDPTSEDDLVSTIKEIVPNGVNNALDTTALPEIMEACFDSLGANAILGLVGIAPPGTPMPGNLDDLFMGGKGIKSIVEGDSNPDEFIPELVAHYQAGKLPIERLIKTYKLSEINQAIADQKSGACLKAVLIPDSEEPSV